MKICKDAVRVAKERAEEVRRRLLALRALEESLKPAQLGEYVIFPLKALDDDLRKVIRELRATIIRHEFEARPTRGRSLEEILRKKIPDKLLQALPSSYDIVGDLILIEIPDALRGCAREIGEALTHIHPKVKGVLM